MNRKIVLILIIIASQVHFLKASNNNYIIEIHDIYPDNIAMKGFTLDKEMEIEINATIGVWEKRDHLLSACWILNADNRKVVWECTEDNGIEVYRGREMNCEQNMVLPKGNYEVYHYTEFIQTEQWNGNKNLAQRIGRSEQCTKCKDHYNGMLAVGSHKSRSDKTDFS